MHTTEHVAGNLVYKVAGDIITGASESEIVMQMWEKDFSAMPTLEQYMVVVAERLQAEPTTDPAEFLVLLAKYGVVSRVR